MGKRVTGFLVTVVALAAGLLGPAWPAEVLLPESWAGQRECAGNVSGACLSDVLFSRWR